MQQYNQTGQKARGCSWYGTRKQTCVEWRAGFSAAPNGGNAGTDNLKPSILIKLHIDLLEYNKCQCFRAVSQK